MNILVNLLRGVAIGISNIIPGVSGGTMALILGIYERLIAALHNVSLTTASAAFGLLRFTPESRSAFADELKRIDAAFLAYLLVGAVAAIGASAKLITYLLTHQHDPTYGFFFGLVLVSILVPIRMMKRFGAAPVVAAVLACILTVGIGMAKSPEEILASEQKKVELKMAKLAEETAEGAPAHEASFLDRFTLNPIEWAKFFGAGAVAIAAMILPGISGSFVLLVMGMYFPTLEAISRFDVPILAAVALGCGIGLLAFTRLLDVLLKRAHDPTMGFLLGLMVGSLYVLWPFKTQAIVGAGTPFEETLYLRYMMPDLTGANFWITIAAAVVGGLIVAAFLVVEAKTGSSEGK